MNTSAGALILFLFLAPSVRCGEPNPPCTNSIRCVEYYAQRYQVPVELVEAVVEVESNWQPDAVSPKGAVGLMQLMPAAAVRFGVRSRFHIEENIRAGVEYLAWLMRLFRGDLRLTVAAYYAGERPILAQGLAYSSPDVYRYVARVARLYRAKQPARAQTALGAWPQD